MNLSLHFTEEEFRCHHCGKLPRAGMNRFLIAGLEELRGKLGGHPVTVLSGYRCVKHNKDVGGAKRSFHVKGMAADIKVKSCTVDQIKTAARPIFNGVIPYQGQKFVHCDVRPTKYHPEEG